MLARYKMYRGAQPAGCRLPEGIRQDTRKHQKKHPLHPPAKLVLSYLADPTDTALNRFQKEYLKELQDRFERKRASFDALAALDLEQDVYLGCSCPSQNNPDVSHCHTVLALGFMKRKYPKLKVVFPN